MTTLMDTDMSHWADGTRHYRRGSQDYAVEATLPGANAVPVGVAPMIEELLEIIGEGKAPLQVVVRPTVIFACTREGFPTDEHGLTPLAKFPPGTSHDDALAHYQGEAH